ncbi:uncharacterized protein [Dysidea avara]|uniref:uncharacterized protein isoform X2 n=1 Tax=Dysidea avara TaxID=196820 RepID=UPI00331A9617
MRLSLRMCPSAAVLAVSFVTRLVSCLYFDCPTLRLLHRFKKEISKNWFDLGVELINDSANELNNLQENHPKDAEKCCSKMFQLWLKKCSEATWNQLIKALRVLGIEMFELANKIESMLLMEPVQAKTVPVGIYYMDTQRYKNSPVTNSDYYLELQKPRRKK